MAKQSETRQFKCQTVLWPENVTSRPSCVVALIIETSAMNHNMCSCHDFKTKEPVQENVQENEKTLRHNLDPTGM